MHGRVFAFGDFFYGFGPKRLFLRIDPVAETMAEMPNFELRITLWDSRETRISLLVEKSKLTGCVVEQGGTCLLQPETVVQAAYGKIIEVGVARELFDLHDRRELLLRVALCEAGLPVDVLPSEGVFPIALGEENFAWETDRKS
jgi:hypothetical protein